MLWYVPVLTRSGSDWLLLPLPGTAPKAEQRGQYTDGRRHDSDEGLGRSFNAVIVYPGSCERRIIGFTNDRLVVSIITAHLSDGPMNGLQTLIASDRMLRMPSSMVF